MTALLEMRGVTRIHAAGTPREVVALKDIDLTIEACELVAVMGPSGSGKSTLLNCAGALDTPTSGTITLAGTCISGLNAERRAAVRRRDVGFVFQNFNLIPVLTAAENVATPLELDGMRPRRARRLALESLAGVGIEGLADRYPHDMSGGQAQRVAIARALVGRRQLLLADEPTGALDSNTGEAVMELLRTKIDAGAGGLLVTHEPRFAAWADRTVFLADGQIASATKDDRLDALAGTP
ncbi:macrolide ABC transporter ATP-binding protein [Bowdeniella nasicola]|uniref:Macrolide ABC transporter ATP-binding protein n=1 Tax=Bowdeniella nasicola TaxID=208480 RepID=A0A1Q5Q0Z0_9ACTO|nr:ABC transporter ATP-binding protein [Bowdeniella nasicola]OKL53395.1 macrolide ABC transporter ATP-binding protein [Bowdeniella nasicola]